MKRSYSHRRQRGFTVLLTSVVILAVVTMITIYAANTTITEQRISATQYRGDQALAAADAALEWGLSYFVNGLDQDTPPDGNVDCRSDSPCLAEDIFVADIRAEVFFCRLGTVFRDDFLTCPPPLLDAKRIGVAAIGYSDDDSARRVIRQEMDSIQLFSEGPKSAVTTPSMVDLTGTVDIINRYFNTTVWSGDSVVAWGNARSFVRNPDAQFNNIPPGQPGSDYERLVSPIVNNDDTSLASSKDWQESNFDILDGDVNLKKLRENPDMLFRSVFNGASKDTFKRAARQLDQYFEAQPTAAQRNDMAGYVYIKGQDVDISGIGAVNPVLLFVEGSVRINGGEFSGFLYVGDPDRDNDNDGNGDMRTNGNPIMRGAIVLEGSFWGGGTPRLIYDPHAFDSSRMPTIAARLSGTWRDW